MRKAAVLTGRPTDLPGLPLNRLHLTDHFLGDRHLVALPAFDAQALLHAWKEAVYALYLREEKIESAVVEQIRGWRHSGFSVDQSVYLRAGDQAAVERLMQYPPSPRLRRARIPKLPCPP